MTTNNKADKSKSEVYADVLTTVQRFLLTYRMLPPIDVVNVAKNFRAGLQILRYLLQLRKAFIERGNQLGDAIDVTGNRFKGWDGFHRRKSGGGFRNSWAEGWREKSGKQNPIKMTDTQELFVAFTEWEEQSKQFDTLVTQSIVLACNIFGWSERSPMLAYCFAKKILPIGGRNAMSIWKAFYDGEGKRDNCLPSEHKIAGWGYQFDETGIKRAQKNLLPILEKGGKAPSVVSGRELLRKYNAIDDTQSTFHPLYRDAWKRELSKDFRALGYSHNVEGTIRGSSFLKAWKMCNQNLHNKQVKVMYRIMEMVKEGSGTYRQKSGEDYRNTVPTILIGEWYRVGVSDYACKCIAWGEKIGATEGLVITRQGWNDLVHCKLDITPEKIAENLDKASAYFFDRRKSALERKLSQRQRIVKLLVMLRGLPIVSVQNSLATGNCSQGTYAFCKQLGVETSSIDGRTLARKWKAVSYPQIDRFAGVILSAKKQQDDFVSQQEQADNTEPFPVGNFPM